MLSVDLLLERGVVELESIPRFHGGKKFQRCFKSLFSAAAAAAAAAQWFVIDLMQNAK